MIYQEPSIKTYGNDWVLVAAPLSGYAETVDLAICSPARFP